MTNILLAFLYIISSTLTDIARYKSDMPHDVVKNWMRTRETIEFLGIWESWYNMNFKQVEFDLFRGEAGLNLQCPQQNG